MTRPAITINGKKYEMKKLTGRDWRILGEFTDDAPKYDDADFIEKHAAFVAKFYDDLTADDVLDLPIEEILPASLAIRRYVMQCLTGKIEQVEKNSEADKAQ